MPPRRSEILSPYRRAQIRARALSGRLAASSIRDMRDALEDYADAITRRLASLPRNPSQAQLQRILGELEQLIRFQSAQLSEELLQVMGARRTEAFEGVLELWQEAGERALVLAGRSGLAAGLVSPANIRMAGAYETLGGAARTWKTLLPQYALRGGAEVDAIMRGSLLQGVSPDKLARALRRYVTGSRQFEAVAREFGLEVDIQDLRSLARQALHDPRARTLLNVSQTMRHNSERIAFSEVFNARKEAEVQQYQDDPMVEAVGWRLSPAHSDFDECDVLATQDLYGLGPGIYPVTGVPLPPHPWDQCEQVPVVRPFREFGQPKPSPPRRQVNLPKGRAGQQAEAIKS